MPEQPQNVKDLLADAKDASELMVDLAYAAVFFDDEKLAEEVDRLEERMRDQMRDLRKRAVLAARSPEDAEAIESVLWIARAIETIGDAASDIARVVKAKLGIPEILLPDLRHANEVSGRVRISEESGAIGQTLRELSLPTETGMWLLAIRHGSSWEFDPGPDTVLASGDVLLFQGPEDGINEIRGIAGAAPLPEDSGEELPPLSELDRAVDIIIEMKNSAEAAVGMAYSCLLFQDRALAAEVAAIEDRVDHLDDELGSWVLRAAPEARNPDELRGLLRIAAASEWITDAARDMTWYVEQGEEMHPVIQMALEETEETSAETVVHQGSPADGAAIRDLRVETETGMWIVAIERGNRWFHRPRAGFRLQSGDRVISIGPEEGEADLATLFGAPLPDDD